MAAVSLASIASSTSVESLAADVMVAVVAADATVVGSLVMEAALVGVPLLVALQHLILSVAHSIILPPVALLSLL
jgi:hypothetical protein